MIQRLMLTLMPVLALGACGGKEDGGKKDPGKTAESKDGDRPAKTDPTLSWKEQRGPGFVVLAARAPSEQKGTSKDPLVTQVTTYSGYEPEGSKLRLEIIVTEYSDKIAEVDPLKIMREASKQPTVDMPGTKVEEMVAIGGELPGMDARYSGEEPQLGAFAMRQRVFLKDKVLYIIRARAPAADKVLIEQGQAFALSFKPAG